MIQADNVVQLPGGSQALNPPGIAGLRHLFPVVNGVAPELAVCGEGIRRAARHLFRMAAFVQLEQLRICPHVRRIQGHVNGNVADNPDALGVGVAAQRLPLFVKFILSKELAAGFPRTAPGAFPPEHPPSADAELPASPARACRQGVLQRREQSIVFQPAPVLLYEGFVGFIRRKPLKSQPQHVHPVGVHGTKIYPASGYFPRKCPEFPLFSAVLRPPGCPGR